MAQLSWVKCDGDEWCRFEDVNLSNVHVTGVYIIWHDDDPGKVVRVGQGDIADRIGDHRNDLKILEYASQGTLYVTWASVLSDELDGVEAHLAQFWKPLVGERFPDAVPIPVNSPFD